MRKNNLGCNLSIILDKKALDNSKYPVNMVENMGEKHMTTLQKNDTHSLHNVKRLANLLVHEVYDTDLIPLRKILGSKGNKKLPATTAIFNMSSAHACASRKLGLCKAEKAGVKCYAVKAENSYYAFTESYRNRQEIFWKATTAAEFAVQFILINALRNKPFTALRFNEAGDFHTQECVRKADRIAHILRPYEVISYCYTSRDDLDYSKITALKISGSGFQKKGITNIYQIIETKEDIPKGFVLCPGNCKICDRCMKSGMKTAVLKH